MQAGAELAGKQAIAVQKYRSTEVQKYPSVHNNPKDDDAFSSDSL